MARKFILTGLFDQQAAQAKIADQIKIDVLTTSQDIDNAAHMKNVSRSFICKSKSNP